MARPARPERSRSALPLRQLSRFCHLINSDIVFGTHRELISSRNAPKAWKRPFDEPIPLPRRRQLVTLEDAGKFITKLPKAEHDAEEWLAAMEALLLVAEPG